MVGWGAGGGCSHVALLSAHRTACRELFPANRCHQAASGVCLKVRHGRRGVVVVKEDGFRDKQLLLQRVEVLNIRDMKLGLVLQVPCVFFRIKGGRVITQATFL